MSSRSYTPRSSSLPPAASPTPASDPVERRMPASALPRMSFATLPCAVRGAGRSTVSVGVAGVLPCVVPFSKPSPAALATRGIVAGVDGDGASEAAGVALSTTAATVTSWLLRERSISRGFCRSYHQPSARRRESPGGGWGGGGFREQSRLVRRSASDWHVQCMPHCKRSHCRDQQPGLTCNMDSMRRTWSSLLAAAFFRRSANGSVPGAVAFGFRTRAWARLRRAASRRGSWCG